MQVFKPDTVQVELQSQEVASHPPCGVLILVFISRNFRVYANMFSMTQVKLRRMYVTYHFFCKEVDRS